MTAAPLDRIRFTAASARDIERGLVGFVAFRMAELFIVDSVAVRLTRDGRLSLSFPELRGAHGRRKDIIRPIDATARAALENTIFKALRETGDCPFAAAAEPAP